MKKTLFALVMFISVAGMAQTEFKPEKGNFTTELQFSLLGEQPFSIDGLRFRYFFNEKWALRATLNVNYNSSKIVRDLDNEIDNSYSTSNFKFTSIETTVGENVRKQGSVFVGIVPGVEYHFGKTERLSFYVGGEILLGFQNHHFKLENNVKTTHYEKVEEWYNGQWNPRSESTSSEELNRHRESKNMMDEDTPSSFVLGINALMGIDFYLYKGLYMGAELGFGYRQNFSLKGKITGESTITTTAINGSTTSSTEDLGFEPQIKQTSTSLRFHCNPAIRLGWKF